MLGRRSKWRKPGNCQSPTHCEAQEEFVVCVHTSCIKCRADTPTFVLTKRACVVDAWSISGRLAGMFQIAHTDMRAGMMSISSRISRSRAGVQARILYPCVSSKHGNGCVRGRSPSQSGRESTRAGSKLIWTGRCGMRRITGEGFRSETGRQKEEVAMLRWMGGPRKIGDGNVGKV